MRGDEHERHDCFICPRKNSGYTNHIHMNHMNFSHCIHLVVVACLVVAFQNPLACVRSIHGIEDVKPVCVSGTEGR